MLVRLLRAGAGVLMLLLAVPLTLAGGGLWLVTQHRATDGTFSAAIERVRTDGHAIVATDVDALLRADLPFARGGQTTVSLSAHGPVFLGLAPLADIERYLDGVAQARLHRIRPARGPLPVDVAEAAARRLPDGPRGVTSTELPGPPGNERFWLATNADGHLRWSPSALRGRPVALVVMNGDASAGVDVALRGRLEPAWLTPTTNGLLILGGATLLLGVLTLAWPSRSRSRSRSRPDGSAGTTAVAVGQPSGSGDVTERRADDAVSPARAADRVPAPAPAPVPAPAQDRVPAPAQDRVPDWVRVGAGECAGVEPVLVADSMSSVAAPVAVLAGLSVRESGAASVVPADSGRCADVDLPSDATGPADGSGPDETGPDETGPADGSRCAIAAGPADETGPADGSRCAIAAGPADESGPADRSRRAIAAGSATAADLATTVLDPVPAVDRNAGDLIAGDGNAGDRNTALVAQLPPLPKVELRFSWSPAALPTRPARPEGEPVAGRS